MRVPPPTQCWGEGVVNSSYCVNLKNESYLLAKMGLFRNKRIAVQDIQATAKPQASPIVNKGEGSYFIQKEEEVGRGCSEGKHKSTVVMGPQWLSSWDGGLKEMQCTLFPLSARN